MTQYNTLNVKLFNSQLDRLKSEIKNGIEVTLKLLSIYNFLHKSLLANTQA